jgi:hypothetical protein
MSGNTAGTLTHLSPPALAPVMGGAPLDAPRPPGVLASKPGPKPGTWEKVGRESHKLLPGSPAAGGRATVRKAGHRARVVQRDARSRDGRPGSPVDPGLVGAGGDPATVRLAAPACMKDPPWQRRTTCPCGGLTGSGTAQDTPGVHPTPGGPLTCHQNPSDPRPPQHPQVGGSTAVRESRCQKSTGRNQPKARHQGATHRTRPHRVRQKRAEDTGRSRERGWGKPEACAREPTRETQRATRPARLRRVPNGARSASNPGSRSHEWKQLYHASHAGLGCASTAPRKKCAQRLHAMSRKRGRHTRSGCHSWPCR